MKQKHLFFILVACFNLAANYAHPVTPTYFKQLGLDNSMFGLAFSVMSFGIFIASPFWGKVTQMINSKTAMSIGSVGYAFAQILFAIGRQPWIILFGRLIAGLACGAFFVGTLNYISNTSTEQQRGTNLTLNVTIQTVASALGYFIGGLIGDYNIYLAFILQIAQLALVGLAFNILVPDKVDKSQLDWNSILKNSNPLVSFKSAGTFMNRQFARLFIISILLFIGYTAFDQTFNYYLKDIFEMTSGFNGIFKGAVGMVSLFINMALGIYLIKRQKIHRILAWDLCIAALTMLCLCWDKHLILSVGISLIFYATYTIATPILQKLIVDNATKSNRNLVLGFYQSMQSLGQILGAYIAGIIYDFHSKSPFGLAMLVFVIAVIFCFRLSSQEE